MNGGVANSGNLRGPGIGKKAVSLVLVSLMITSGLLIFSDNAESDVLSGVTITVPDDYGTIGEALAHVNDGDIIQVRSGTWQMGINIFKKITLRSVSGAEATVLETGSYYGIYLYTEVRIEGFTLRHASTALLIDQNSLRSNVSGCIFLNTTVQVQAAEVEFWNNTLIGNPSYGFQLSWSGDEASIVKNRFNATNDLYLTGNNASVRENEFDNAEAIINGENSTFSGNLLANTSYEALTVNGKNCVIGENNFRDIGRRGIVLQAGPNLVENNHLLRCGETGVYVTSSAYGGEANVIGWNTFDECDFAIQIGYQEHTRFHNNTILNGNPDGTRESNVYISSDQNIIENNTLYGCSKHGMSVRGENNQIRYNNVSTSIGPSDSAIAIYEQNNNVLYNDLFQNDGNGVMSYGNDCAISRNKIMFNGNFGIRIFSTGCSVTWNDIIYNEHSAESAAGNLWDHNLYSDYNGPDANNDGIGDLPHPIPIDGVQDEQPRYLKATDTGVMNLGLVPFDYDTGPADGAVYHDPEYYEVLGQKLIDYYSEVSYGQLQVSVQILLDDGDQLYHLHHTKAQLAKLSGKPGILSELVQMVDDDHDLRAYDYNVSGGKGCLAFIAPCDVEGDDSAFIWAENAAVGALVTNDSTRIDYIYIFNQRFNGENKTVRGLAHEFGHFLGKALVTSVSNRSKDDKWVLPDEYLMGNLDAYTALMGMKKGELLERVHLDSYTKEWLGWLTYANVSHGGSLTIPALTSVGYGGTVYRLLNEQPASGGGNRVSYLLFEYRTNSTTQSDWDIETESSHALHIHLVNVRPDSTDSINKYRVLRNEGDITGSGIFHFKIEVLEMNDTSVRISLNSTLPVNVTGAVMSGDGTVVGAASATARHDRGGWTGYPDTDLHAMDKFGRHVGVNATTGEYDMQIPGVDCSGDLLNGLEWIYLPEELEPVFWVDAMDSQDFLSDNPQYSGIAMNEGFAIMMQHFDAQGVEVNTMMRERIVTAGESYHADYTLTRSGSETVLVLDDSLHAVTFRQSGLTAGTSWSVTVGSKTAASVNATVTMQLVSGPYQYTVGAVNGFEADPDSGTLTLMDLDMTVDIEFSPVSDPGNGFEMNILALVAIVIGVALVVATLALRKKGRRERV